MCNGYARIALLRSARLRKDGKDYGFTANSFTSVSLDPMLILFCIQKNAKSNVALIEKNRFVVSILSEKQEEICYRFSDPTLDQLERFKNVKIINEWPNNALEKIETSSNFALITLTHDPKIDDPALNHALKNKFFYLKKNEV